jgi:hypothetical protein
MWHPHGGDDKCIQNVSQKTVEEITWDTKEQREFSNKMYLKERGCENVDWM